MTELVWQGKYDKNHRKAAPVRLALPFQNVETVNESAQERQRRFDLFASARDTEWRDRLIWGDKKYVLPSLLAEFRANVNLIYIDPPFDTGANFTLPIQVGDEDFIKEPSVLEMKAYRDTWGKGLDSYLQWFYETAVLLKELLAENGSLIVHLDYRVGPYAKVVLDEIFGSQRLVAEIIWHYSGAGVPNDRPARRHDNLYWYSNSEQWTFNADEVRMEYAEATKERFGHAIGNVRGGRDYGQQELNPKGKWPEDVVGISIEAPSSNERTGYPTQKPRALLEWILKACSNEGDLVLDCFAGSGTTAVVAEQLARRWIVGDLGRFAIHTTRKRLLSIEGLRPFVVQNLGKYERQAWQRDEFSPDTEEPELRYRSFILKLYDAKPVAGRSWLHGVRGGRFVHVGAVDAPISPGDVTQMVIEFQKSAGKSKGGGIDVLGWDFAFELNEVARQQASMANVDLRFFRIPRDVMDRKAVEQGDIRFFELGALSVALKRVARSVSVTLQDFVIPLDDVPSEIQRAIKDWSQWIDYWAVDWDNRSDTFHNQWQSYRTRKRRKIDKVAKHEYDAAGPHLIVVKVIDILGNDTTKTLQVEVP